MTRPPSLDHLEPNDDLPPPARAGERATAGMPESGRPKVHPCWPWLDVLGVVTAAIAWQQIVAWSSWVWLLPGAATSIAFAAGLVATGRWAVRSLPPAPPPPPPNPPTTPGPRQLLTDGVNPLLLTLVALGCGGLMGWHALWVIPGDMLGLGVLTGLLAVIHVSQQVPERWWPLRLLVNAAIVGALILLTSTQPMPPLLRLVYLTSLVALAIMAARSRGYGFSALVPREIFGAVVFALGVGIAPHFMANNPPGAWLGREFLACLLVIALGRLCLSVLVLPSDPRQAAATDPVAWVTRRPSLRAWLPALLMVGIIAGGLLLADPSGRGRWIGAAVMLSLLWMLPAVASRAPRDPAAPGLLLPAWVALGPAVGPAAVWWLRGWLG